MGSGSYNIVSNEKSSFAFRVSFHLELLRCIAFYQGSVENGVYFSILEESLVDLTFLTRNLIHLLLYYGL